MKKALRHKKFPKNLTTKINPNDINLKSNFMGSVWGNRETEASAYFLCKMAKKMEVGEILQSKKLIILPKKIFGLINLRMGI